MWNSGEQCFLKFLELRGKGRCLVYGSIQVFSAGWILDLNLQLCWGRKCLRGIAYYEWRKKVIFF